MKIGVLAVQGAFAEHEKMLAALGVASIELRNQSNLNASFDGIILPGGESTVMGKLLRELEMFDGMKSMIKCGMPVLGTCAGLILLAQHIENDDKSHFATLPVTVRRNAYGRQLGSFRTTENIKGIGSYPMTFIRAPYIASCEDKEVEILAKFDEKTVAVKYRNQIGLSFHPEVTENTAIHEMFLKLC